MRRELLQHYTATQGKNAAETLRVQADLGLQLYREGRDEEAEVLLTESLAGSGITLGDDHRDTLVTTQVLGRLYYRTERPEEAARHFARVVDGWPRHFGDEDSGTVGATRNLRQSLRDLENRRDLVEPLRILYRIDCRTRALDHPDREESSRWFSQALLHGEHWEEAEEVLIEVSDAQSEDAPFDDPDLNWTLAQLAAAYTGQERYDEAEPLLLDAYEAVAPARQATVAAQLADLYRRMEQPDEAAQWDGR